MSLIVITKMTRLVVILPVVMFMILLLLMVDRSEGVPRDQLLQLSCNNQIIGNQRVFAQNFIQTTQKIGAQVRSSLFGSGSTGISPDRVFGLAQCFGDLSTSDCIICYEAARFAISRCFPRTGGILYQDGCFMRSQNYSFYDEYTGPSDTRICGNDTLMNGSVFGSSARQAVSNAVRDTLVNVDYFAREEVLSTRGMNESVYVLANCWKTLNVSSCRSCLEDASASLLQCLPWSEGRVLNTGCFMRYSNTNFLNAVPVRSTSSNQGIHLSVILPIVFTLVVVSFTLIVYAWRKKNKPHRNAAQVNKDQKQDSDLPFFSLNEVVKATGNFSSNNTLGQGGFGAVYKGVLEDGGEIAVKRLSKTSRQGLPEFQNEVTCIAKLQHRNLVKLLGCCVQGEEMMLIYEFMPNKSLDSFLFDKNNSVLLDWPQRYHIINGIARGLLYLHQDSRLRIIHRDLKASNILLDSNMNPKISDFGLARMFKEFETEANTNKVVGTLGYISPEYAANGLFSVKSDVFSFGVLVLEIVSGTKNRGFSHQSHKDNLLGHAWRLYKESKPLELVDAALGDSWNVSEVLQSIHVGLSCVQQQADDRPYMSSVVHMLGGDGALPMPKQPGFFTDSTLIAPHVSVSINEDTLSLLDAR